MHGRTTETAPFALPSSLPCPLFEAIPRSNLLHRSARRRTGVGALAVLPPPLQTGPFAAALLAPALPARCPAPRSPLPSLPQESSRAASSAGRLRVADEWGGWLAQAALNAFCQALARPGQRRYSLLQRLTSSSRRRHAGAPSARLPLPLPRVACGAHKYRPT